MADVTQSDDTTPQSAATVEEVPAQQGTVAFRVTGELDLLTVGVLRAAVDNALARSPGRLVFDVEGLRFLDSSCLAVLLGAARQVPVVQLRNPSDIVRRVVTMSGLGSTFDLTP
jgi:anti-sigma B factor antagonist